LPDTPSSGKPAPGTVGSKLACICRSIAINLIDIFADLIDALAVDNPVGGLLVHAN